MKKSQIENIKILKQIRRNLHNKKRECMVDSCKENAINSHLLQRHGILNNIIEDGHMMELRPNDMFKWNREESPIVFKRVGLNDVSLQYDIKEDFDNKHGAPNAAAPKVFMKYFFVNTKTGEKSGEMLTMVRLDEDAPADDE